MRTRSDFWTDPRRMEADRRWLITRLAEPGKVTRANITAARRMLEHCVPVPEVRGGDTGCAGLTPAPEVAL